MRVEKMFKQRIFSALVAIVMMLSLSGVGVVWQYVDSYSSDSQNSLPSLSSDASASDVKGKAPSTGSSFATDGSLWSWGGSPRGFSVTNGTIKYPDDYYTSHFNLGYNKSKPSYGQNKLQNLSQYSTGFATGFTTGYYPGYNIYSLLSDGKSSYDPWNNYPGYDPNYPYGYAGS
ncbi:MAG: hypothetical protein M0Q13_12025 [Methanothrix sp.]|jgi:hypothetical protein|nr:hypothetical protein [Methanothrix sp.]